MKITRVPEQEGFCEAVTVTLTARLGLTITGYWMLDAGLFVVQVSEDVKVQYSRSPFEGM